MKIKELRKENKKSREEISKLLNVALSTYGGYEQETSEPTIDTLCKLADYYDVSLDYLVDRNYRNEFAYLTEDEKQLLTDYKQLNKINKIKILSELKGFLIAQN